MTFSAIIAFAAAFGFQDPTAVGDAEAMLLRGNYREAIELYDSLKGVDPVRIALGKAKCLASEGKYADAIVLLTAATLTKPDAAALHAALAELLAVVGKYDDAESAAKRAVELAKDNVHGRWMLYRINTLRGRDVDPEKDLRWFIDYYNRAQPTDPEVLFWTSRGSIEFAVRTKRHDELDFILNDMLADALKANSGFWQAKWMSGALLLDKYNRAQGVPDLQAALKLNPQAAEVLVSLGEAALQDYDYPNGHALADQALGVNPNFIPALMLKADLLVSDSRQQEALPFVERALKVNPVSEDALARSSAVKHLTGDSKGAERLDAEMLKTNPKPGRYYNAAAELLGKRLRFDVAERYYQQAIAATPYLASPLNGYGILLMRLGKEDEARKTFAAARDIDPYHVRVLNMVKVLKHMEEYKIVTSPHYEVYVSPDDLQLGRDMSEYLEEIHPTLVKRFGYEAPGRTKIEIMKTHQWFSGRVVGTPSVGTVGACTGRVVALTSPSSLKDNKFNWARVLTHEVVHIITLGQTNFNIPHWYTEALAVLSEGYPRPEVWNELLSERVPKGDLLNLDTVNHAFIRPKTPLDWQFAYCTSLLYAQYMLERFGENSLARLLDAYAKGMETDKAIPETFKVSKADFEKGYSDYLKKVAAELGAAAGKKSLTYAEAQRAYREKPNDPDVIAALATKQFERKNAAAARELATAAIKAKPDHPEAVTLLARMEASIGKYDEAVKMLEPAMKADQPNPMILELFANLRMRQKKYAEAADLYDAARKRDPLRVKWLEGLVLALMKEQEAGRKIDPARFENALEALANTDPDNAAARRKLAELAVKAKNWPRAEKWSKETLHVEPADHAANQMLADAYAGQKKHKQAAERYEVLLHDDEEEADAKAAALLAAEQHLAAGDNAKARKLLDAVIKEEPTNGKAKDLLKKAGGAKTPTNSDP
jgi:tetratricopeptide (TPR) repeat protein